MKPTLSVVTPNFNHAPVLPFSIESVLSQSRPPDQYIIIDDGSTDNSLEIIRDYARRHPLISVIENRQNRGLEYVLRQAPELITGDHVFFLAADDFVLPGFFEHAMSAAAAAPEAGLIFGAVRSVNREGKMLEEWCAFPRGCGLKRLSPSEFLTDYLDHHSAKHSLSPATIYKSTELKSVGGFRKELGHWADTFAVRSIGLGRGAVYLDMLGAAFRESTGGYSAASWNDPVRMLDIVARAAWLMRSPTFRERFPEWHVCKWEQEYRGLIIDDCGGVARAYYRAGALYLGLFEKLLPASLPPARVLWKAGAPFRRIQLMWLRFCLSRYKGDISCYLEK
jgi:glycosyltransferase involved in cell wall biosynthesis